MKALVSNVDRIALMSDGSNVVLFNNPSNIGSSNSKIDLSTRLSSTKKKKNDLLGLLPGDNENIYALSRAGLLLDLTGKELGSLECKIYSMAQQHGSSSSSYLCIAQQKKHHGLTLCSFDLTNKKVSK